MSSSLLTSFADLDGSPNGSGIAGEILKSELLAADIETFPSSEAPNLIFFEGLKQIMFVIKL